MQQAGTGPGLQNHNGSSRRGRWCDSQARYCSTSRVPFVDRAKSWLLHPFQLQSSKGKGKAGAAGRRCGRSTGSAVSCLPSNPQPACCWQLALSFPTCSAPTTLQPTHPRSPCPPVILVVCVHPEAGHRRAILLRHLSHTVEELGCGAATHKGRTRQQGILLLLGHLARVDQADKAPGSGQGRQGGGGVHSCSHTRVGVH